MTIPDDVATMDALWRDAARPVAERVEALVAAMTLDEKLAQLYGVWVGASDEGGDVAPHQHDLNDDVDLDELLPARARPAHPAVRHGAGRRRPSARSRSCARRSASSPRTASASRRSRTRSASPASPPGAPTAYPVPLSWGATFDPELVERMAAASATTCAAVGVHQGLAPVLDVVRDARWGRVEETIGEDPYLVGTIGTAYVRGLESAGVVATLKHFVGYSASRAGRNLAPVSIGPARARRRAAAAVRDGAPRGRRPRR